MKRKCAPQTRFLLSSIAAKLAEKGYTSDELVERFLRDHGDKVAAERDDVLHIGLMKIAADVGGRSAGRIPTAQTELFQEYSIGRTLALRIAGPEGNNVVRKLTTALTRPELRAYIDNRPIPKLRNAAELAEIVRLEEDMGKAGVSDTTTVGDFWKNIHGEKKGEGG
jgi:hypothetical protein